MAKIGMERAKELSTGGGNYFAIRDDKETATVRFLYENEEQLDLYAVHEVDLAGRKRYVGCLNTSDCPFCQAGNKPKARLFLQLIDSRDEKIKVWERGAKFFSVISGLINRYGTLIDREFDVERQGAKGDQQTQYLLYPLEQDGMTMAKLKKAGFERQVLEGPDELILTKTEEEMKYFIENSVFPVSARSGEEPGETRSRSSRGRRSGEAVSSGKEVF